MKESVHQYYGKMNLFFKIGYGLFVLFLIMFSVLNDTNQKYDLILVLLFLTSNVCLFIYLYYLGKLVDIYNKSRIVWIGGSFVTAPFGPIVAYINISRLIFKDNYIDKKPTYQIIAKIKKTLFGVPKELILTCQYCQQKMPAESKLCPLCKTPVSSDIKNERMKICPYCAEYIKHEAIKCKHCGSIISV